MQIVMMMVIADKIYRLLYRFIRQPAGSCLTINTSCERKYREGKNLKDSCRNIRHLIILLLPACFSFIRTQAQDSTAWKELDKVFQAYSAGPLTFQGDMRLYAPGDSLHALEDLHTTYTVAGPNRDYILGYVEIIQTPRYFLTVNNHYKTIFITGAKNASGNEDLLDFNALEQSLKSQKVAVTLDTTGREYTLVIRFDNNPQVKSYRIGYSPETHLIDHIHIQLWDANDPGNEDKVKMLAVRYSGYRKPLIKNQDYSERKFLIVEGNKAVLNKRYAGYQLISQL